MSQQFNDVMCVELLSAFLPLPAQEGKDGRSFHSSWQLRVENDCFEGNMRKQSSCSGPQQTAPADPLLSLSASSCPHITFS